MVDDRLVQDCSQIILLLLRGKSSVNDIIKQTGIYKNYVFEANRFLEQSRFVVRASAKGIHKQKVFVELTEFGRKLAGFIKSTDIFDKSLEALKRVIKINFDIHTEGKTLRSLLRRQGWSDEEIEQYAEYEEYMKLLENDCLSVIIYGITNLYSQYLLRFDPNKSAKELLEKIVITKLSKYLISQVESTVNHKSFKCKDCGMENSLGANELMENNCQRLLQGGFIADYVHIPFNMRIVTREVKDILKSLFLVMDFPSEYLKHKVEEELQILNSCDPGNPNVASRKRLISYCAELS